MEFYYMVDCTFKLQLLYYDDNQMFNIPDQKISVPYQNHFTE
ncbi:hypothetical protein T11_13683 [Trichinella zimbabwensis]|uniref:Uncharacterized protein n=1 Tax=Trichinella zimbabwensis TaxID=268475 RepID=A0A0V1G9H3_9BILA|nr:hypothetical protein T11_13683 [Trichinella zimbabwensis]